MILSEEPSLLDYIFPRLETVVVDEWEMSVNDFVYLSKNDRSCFRKEPWSPFATRRAVGWKIPGQGVRKFPQPPVTEEETAESEPEAE